MIARSPLAPASFPDLPAIDGVEIAAAETGLKYKGRPDLLVMKFADGTQVAGVFTRSLSGGCRYGGYADMPSEPGVCGIHRGDWRGPADTQADAAHSGHGRRYVA